MKRQITMLAGMDESQLNRMQNGQMPGNFAQKQKKGKGKGRGNFRI